MSVRSLLLVLVPLLVAGHAAAQDPDAARLLDDADTAFEAGDTAAARAIYGYVLRLDPYQSRAVYQLGRLEPPGSAAQIERFRRYTELEPDDAWGFAALGAAYRDAGALDRARAAYRHGVALAPAATDIRQALDAIEPRRSRTFSVEPIGRFAGDSDGNGTTQLGAGGTLRLGSGGRYGAEAVRLVVSDGVASVAGWTAALSAVLRPRRELTVAGRAGFLSARDEGSGAAVHEPIARARVRWRPVTGPAVELRGRHEPVTATPLLLAGPVVLSEVRGTLEIPLMSSVYTRGVVRYGRLVSPDDVNTRTLIGAGPALRLAPTLELNVLAGRGGYANPSTAGYFAPDRTDILDVGVYWEHEGAGPLVLALDAGAGLERITAFDGTQGGWGRALRLWSQLSWSFRPGAALRVEVEAYDTRAGEALVATSEGWRWGSLDAALEIRR